MTTRNENALPLPNPDFTAIKSSLKEFMRNYDDLKDYDFEGSTLSILLDTLAYNSHLNAFWLNMVGNESFLKTAVKRNNVVAAAKDLGYTPTTAKSAFTDLYLEFEPTDTSNIKDYITILEGSTFTAATDTSSYTFNVLSRERAYFDYNINKYVVDNVRVHEGRLLVYEWDVVTKEVLGEPHKVQDIVGDGVSIPNLNVDSNLLRVFVNEAGYDESDGIYRDSYGFTEYAPFDDSLDIDKDSRQYFLNEDSLGRVNISFGDNNLGFRPPAGSKIRVSYVVSSGPAANGIGKFNFASPIEGVTISKVTPRYPSVGGAFTESIESIKHNAQLAYESQGKAVVTGDYEYLVRKIYPNAKKVITWGGQDHQPFPQYGKVFICIQPYSNTIVTTKEKQEIISYIEDKNVTTIIPVIVDPEYVYIDLDIKLKLRSNLISRGPIESKVLSNVKEFSTNRLNSFDKSLEYSRLLSAIDNSAPEILSNSTIATLTKRINIIDGVQQEYSINFGNSLEEGSIVSSTFSYGTFNNCYLKSSGKRLQIATILSEDGEDTEVIISSEIGTVDYEKGVVSIGRLDIKNASLFFDNLSNAYYMKLSAKPKSNNIISNRNQILNIENIKVS